MAADEKKMAASRVEEWKNGEKYLCVILHLNLDARRETQLEFRRQSRRNISRFALILNAQSSEVLLPVSAAGRATFFCR
jgi:hypothetical protein